MKRIWTILWSACSFAYTSSSFPFRVTFFWYCDCMWVCNFLNSIRKNIYSCPDYCSKQHGQTCSMIIEYGAQQIRNIRKQICMYSTYLCRIEDALWATLCYHFIIERKEINHFKIFSRAPVAMDNKQKTHDLDNRFSISHWQYGLEHGLCMLFEREYVHCFPLLRLFREWKAYQGRQKPQYSLANH